MLTRIRQPLPMRNLLLLLTLVPTSALAQSISGPASVIDGDTISLTGERVRLYGIDAPEIAQTCSRDAADWACGRSAQALLTQIAEGRVVECTPQDRDAYGRIVATCRVGDRDLSQVMVREGLAIALAQAPDEYREAENRAKAFGLALWGSSFQTPADYRQANPTLFAPPTRRVVARPLSLASRPQAAQGASFRNCAAARAAGAAPLYRGQTGYGSHMDRDGDGVACEPYRGR